MSTQYESALVWFRRDLRDYDHAALSLALQSAAKVHCVFVFDTTILDLLSSRQDRRVEFIRESLVELDQALAAQGGGLMVLHGEARHQIPQLVRELGVEALFANRDYEPATQVRDAQVAADLAQDDIPFITPKDQVIFDGTEILTQARHPYTVFTPYKNAWLKKLGEAGGDGHIHPHPVETYTHHLTPPTHHHKIPTLAELGFEDTNLKDIAITPGMSGARQTWERFQDAITHYKSGRNFPAIRGVSYLSVHLRFGTLSIRELVASAWRMGGEGPETWLSELIWRDFYFMLLAAFPHVEKGAFKPEFDALNWDEWPEGLSAWKEARTGYPLVDAAMRQINQTGYMHNRLRMVVASFLTKDLGISWQQGEQYFADHLNDFDLSANNGGWQWAASTGCDAQPWFRIFNPITQSEKFDPQGRFIRRYLPELTQVPDKYIHAPWTMPPNLQQEIGVVIGKDYPLPIVNHAEARKRTLARFEAIKKTP